MLLEIAGRKIRKQSKNGQKRKPGDRAKKGVVQDNAYFRADHALQRCVLFPFREKEKSHQHPTLKQRRVDSVKAKICIKTKSSDYPIVYSHASLSMHGLQTICILYPALIVVRHIITA